MPFCPPDALACPCPCLAFLFVLVGLQVESTVNHCIVEDVAWPHCCTHLARWASSYIPAHTHTFAWPFYLCRTTLLPDICTSTSAHSANPRQHFLPPAYLLLRWPASCLNLIKSIHEAHAVTPNPLSAFYSFIRLHLCCHPCQPFASFCVAAKPTFHSDCLPSQPHPHGKIPANKHYSSQTESICRTWGCTFRPLAAEVYPPQRGPGPALS